MNNDCRRFEEDEHAKLYAKSRPDYSPDLFNAILNYHSSGGGKFQLAVDVGCGTGHQSTIKLVPHFQKVVGVDVSEAQLEQAPKNVPNLEFRQGSAEEMSFLKSGSVDLLFAASCLHWFDIEQFFKEAERVLRRGGVLAVGTYSRVILPKYQGGLLVQKFYDDYLFDFTTERHKLAITGYDTVVLPFQDFVRKNIDFIMNWTVNQLYDFLLSHSSWRAREKVFPNCDALRNLRDELITLNEVKSTEASIKLQVQFPGQLLLSRK